MDRAGGKNTPLATIVPASRGAVILDEVFFLLRKLFNFISIGILIVFALHANFEWFTLYAAILIISIVVINILFMPFFLKTGKSNISPL